MTKAILLDVEGTTTDVAFVQKVLFPYARERIGDFVRRNAHDAEVRVQLAAVSDEAGERLTDEQAILQLERWIDEDRKATPLKALQGMIWQSGYEAGDFHGHVYADAEHKLRDWYAQGKRLYVYSSGSVQAQKLIFGHTPYGDLTPLLSGYYDTRVGHKRERESYERIASDIGIPADEILFLSDIAEELDAADAAGMQTTQLVREGAIDPAAARHPQAGNFDEVNV